MTRLVRVSEAAADRLRQMSADEGRTMVAVVDRLVGVYVIGEEVPKEDRARVGRLAKAGPPPARVTEVAVERYPWDEEAGPIQVPPKRVGRVPAGGAPEGVRPKGLSEKDWAIRKLKAKRAEEREG